MAPRLTCRLAGFFAGLALFAFELTGPRAASAQNSRIPVVPLKPFTSVSEWQIDITWSAKDSFEDKDWSARAELTATARYILKQLDRQDAWGHWQALSVHSSNISYTSFLANKHTGARTEYRSTAGPVVGALADFQVGQNTPGYLITAQAGFPVKVSGAPGVTESIQVLGTVQQDVPGLSGVCSGPLPAKGTTIHGSTVIPAIVVPFGASAAPKTRLGIQYVIQPLHELAPLVPARKK